MTEQLDRLDDIETPAYERKAAILRVHACVLDVWQTAIAISRHADVTPKFAAGVLRRHAEAWQLEIRAHRFDGHNALPMYRKKQFVTVFGVGLPLVASDESEEGHDGG